MTWSYWERKKNKAALCVTSASPLISVTAWAVSMEAHFWQLKFKNMMKNKAWGKKKSELWDRSVKVMRLNVTIMKQNPEIRNKKS